MKVVIIGAGNVATVFAKTILQSGHEIIQVGGRYSENLAHMASTLNTNFISNLKDINKLAELYIVAVSDHAVAGIARQLQLTNQLVVHTAASVSKEILAGCSANYGVLYPLQSLNKEKELIPPIPVLIDANNERSKAILAEFTGKWAQSVRVAGDVERLKYHLAAVLVNNFTNHLFTLSNYFCNSNNLEFKYLQSIIAETFVRIKEMDPAHVQTGPAIRKDLVTLEKHRTLLENDPHLLQLYNSLTNSILAFHSQNKNGV